MRALLTSDQASLRLARAREFLAGCDPSAPVLIIAPTAEAGSELVRSLARPVFGWRRLTLFRAATELARPLLLERGLALATSLSLDALWARVVFRLDEAGLLGRLTPLVGRPGLAQALSRTVAEARALALPPSRLEPALAAAMTMFDEALEHAHLVDRSVVFELAVEAARPLGAPLVLLDVAPEPGVEAAFVAALAASASAVLATSPRGDEGGVRALSAALEVAPQHLEAPARTALRALQHNLFSSAREDTGHELTALFSAPGEARECIEIARRALERAALGTPFDRMAVALRAPSVYRAPLEEALRRAQIPAYFASGVPTPDPSGRALLALLKCAEEGLSARRFSEYLSLAQVPPADAQGAPPPAASADQRFERPLGETLLPLTDDVPLEPDEEAPVEVDPEGPVQSGQLRAPRKWERLIIDAAVIGGVGRWQRRLAGLTQAKLVELKSPSLTEAQRQRVERQLGGLRALTAFALPLLELLDALPRRASWGEWLEKLGALASRCLKEPRRVLAVLHELSPMSIVGPVGLLEVHSVLAPRLSELTDAPGTRRYGRLFVAPVDQVKGLDFDVVFVPGLAERLFPQKVREDPLLPDSARAALDARLTTNATRIARERLALQVAVGAAKVAAVLSWPRLDAEHSRPRVPSFYALEAAQAVEGALPGYEALQRRAERAGEARLAWPAPPTPARAIDATEYDLSVLAQLFRSRGNVRGRARYLLEASPALRRALRVRYARWTQPRLTFGDGLVAPSGAARTALEAHQLGARPFSPTALEHYAACPYRFFLSAIQRLSPLEIPGEVEELGPLEKGSMTHEVMYELMSELRDEGVKVSQATLPEVFARLEAVIKHVTQKFADDFVPAIEQVWLDGIELLRADLREWLRRVAQDTDWAPWRFELGFGLPQREQQDPSSVTSPVPLTHGLKLRGSIDLVELSTRGTVRATDYKTGRSRAKPGSIVGGGRHLQPVLYALVLEQLLPNNPVEAGRLAYLTQVGGFSTVLTPLDARARDALGQVVLILRSALEQGFFPAMPADGECRWCDFRPVCGPDEERRVRQTRKSVRKELEQLTILRGLP